MAQCGGQMPLKNWRGSTVFCGFGTCPVGSYCHEDEDLVGRYAVCCPGAAPLLSGSLYVNAPLPAAPLIAPAAAALYATPAATTLYASTPAATLYATAPAIPAIPAVPAVPAAVTTVVTQKCFNGSPALDAFGAELSCGLGFGSAACPRGYACKSDAAGAWSVCCPLPAVAADIIIAP